MKYSSKSKYDALYVLIGAIGGTLIGEILGNKFKVLDFLKQTYSIGTPKTIAADLKVLSFSFGLNFNVNLMTIVGVILAIIIIRRH